MKKQRSILQEAVKATEDFAADQKLEKAEVLKMVVDECSRTWYTNVGPRTGHIPTDDAIALIYNINLSPNQCQKLRTLCLP